MGIKMTDMYLIPEPKHLHTEEGFYRINYNDYIVVDENCDFETNELSNLLKTHMNMCLGYTVMRSRGKRRKHCIFLTKDKEKGKEEYELKIQLHGISIIGGSRQGVLYGIQTLRQIISQYGATLPCLTIKDEPDIPNRGFYHDVTRGRIPTLSYLKWLADKLAYYKINQLQLYIEHSFLFEDFSEIWRDDTPLTAEEILELDCYCKNLGIELVPSISCFGHLYKVLSTKTYGYLCELENSEKEEFSFLGRMQHHTIDVSKEESLIFVKKMMEEFIPLFSSNQFNICADETFDLGKGRSKSLADKIGRDNMYIQYVKQLCEFLIEKGKRPMFWGDIIVGFPEAISQLPKETICLNWGYAPNQREEESQKLYEAGATQYSCPGVGGWNQFVNLIHSSYENIKRMCKYAKKYQSLGVLNTDWGDFGHINHPQFSLTGMIYGAAFSWNTEIPTFEDINRQISALEYGDSREAFVSIISQAANYRGFEWEPAVRYMELHVKNAKKEEKESYFKQFDLSKTAEYDKQLERLIDELYRSIRYMKEDVKPLVKPYIIAVEGIKLFNKIGVLIGKKEYGLAFELETNGLELAKELEYWFYYYKETWRMVSKESELYRIQNVIIWYCDYLRSK